MKQNSGYTLLLNNKNQTENSYVTQLHKVNKLRIHIQKL